MSCRFGLVGHRLASDVTFSIASAAFVLAFLSLVPDLVPDPVRWGVLLAAVGLLVLRLTIPDSPERSIDNLLTDRKSFDSSSITAHLRQATEVWIFAPTAINILTQYSEILRTGALSRPDGSVRVVVLNPANEPALQLATRQLDDSVDFPTQDVRGTLKNSLHLLQAMASWKSSGAFAFKFLDYNPGFSLVAINPGRQDGSVIIEFHGFHNIATSSRMHIKLERKESDHWYAYWVEQFNRMWADATTPSAQDPAPTGSGSVLAIAQQASSDKTK